MKTTTPVNCNYTHNVPVIVFSFGLIGNLFHEINEIVIPLFITARHFGSSVHLMVTDYQPWFAHKYNRILTQLSRYQVIDTTLNASDHCFPGAVVGLKYHGNLALNPDSIPGGHTMLEFKELLIFLSQEEGTTSSAYRGKPKYDVSSDPTPRITTTSSDSEKQVDHLETNSQNYNLATAGLTPGGIGGAEGPDRIFVGGLPYYFTEVQIRELLESFGPLRGFDLVKDRDTGNSKGYGLCVYVDQAATDIACAALNGLKIGDKTLTVRRATISGQMKSEQETIMAQAQQHIAMQGFLRAVRVILVQIVFVF
uniref:RRM domain-containing protein n=1 Tax=Lactuca sativa TaxID=4236 RepID=A0A9R1X6D1_LACSA|nr:hypothetical protein LSAT_V11C600333590 [Lactuca sativa]